MIQLRLYLKCTPLQQLCCNIYTAFTLCVHSSSNANFLNPSYINILLEFLKSKLLILFLNTKLLQPIILELPLLYNAYSIFDTNPLQLILGNLTFHNGLLLIPNLWWAILNPISLPRLNILDLSSSFHLVHTCFTWKRQPCPRVSPLTSPLP